MLLCQIVSCVGPGGGFIQPCFDGATGMPAVTNEAGFAWVRTQSLSRSSFGSGRENGTVVVFDRLPSPFPPLPLFYQPASRRQVRQGSTRPVRAEHPDIKHVHDTVALRDLE